MTIIFGTIKRNCFYRIHFMLWYNRTNTTYMLDASVYIESIKKKWKWKGDCRWNGNQNREKCIENKNELFCLCRIEDEQETTDKWNYN